ncbi:hypothetical protein F4860DRAFT_518686 [Xylaria cubensis]|nr:hypothetical protein F4860DRAFT_518686 [Xylaria cubensis]
MAAMERFADKLDKIPIRVRAMERNRIVRLINLLIDRNTPITPLRAIANNTPIANFPPTKAALVRLDEDELNSILQKLGEPLDGDIRAKRYRLKVLAGATNVPDP